MLNDENAHDARAMTPATTEADARTGAVVALIARKAAHTDTQWFRVVLLEHIARRALARGGTYAVSHEQLARDLGVHHARVARAVPHLRRLPYVEVVSGPGRPTRWTITAGVRS